MISSKHNTKGKYKKDDLDQELKDLLKGTQRMPSLLVQNPDSALSDLCLEHYESSTVECMHDVSGHIDQIMEELPF